MKLSIILEKLNGMIIHGKQGVVIQYCAVPSPLVNRSTSFGLTSTDTDLFNMIENSMSGDTEDQSRVNEFLRKHGKDLCRAFHVVLTNVTEPTVVRYALARIDYLLPDGRELRSRVQYFTEKNVVDAAPYLRLIRSAQGYVEHAASLILAKMLSVKPDVEGMKALIDWIIQCLSLGANAVQLVDPVKASSARAAIGSIRWWR